MSKCQIKNDWLLCFDFSQSKLSIYFSRQYVKFIKQICLNLIQKALTEYSRNESLVQCPIIIIIMIMILYHFKYYELLLSLCYNNYSFQKIQEITYTESTLQLGIGLTVCWHHLPVWYQPDSEWRCLYDGVCSTVLLPVSLVFVDAGRGSPTVSQVCESIQHLCGEIYVEGRYSCMV